MHPEILPSATNRIRVLIVDDSAVMRTLLKMVLAGEPRIQVAAAAPNGASGLAMFTETTPDLVLLDIEMPGMDGLEVLHRLRALDRNLPVIMCSTLTRRGAGITLDALAAGASDYVTKPQAQHGITEAVATLKQSLIPKILALCPVLASPAPGLSVPTPRAAAVPARHTAPRSQPSVLAIGISTGGPAALERLLPALPGDFPLPILLVQHMPAIFTGLLAERLNSRCALVVREAVAGALIEPGTVWIAKGDWHMEAAGRPPGATLRLTQALAENHCRPSADVLFRSVARCYGAGALALIMTGMGSDGLEGCRVIRAAGGGILAQDRGSSAVWGMPGVVAQAGVADRVVALDAIAPELLRRVSAHTGFATQEASS